MTKVIDINGGNQMDNEEKSEVSLDVSEDTNSFPYDALRDFCSIRNRGNAYKNGSELTPRLQWIIQFLDTLGIEYEIDEWEAQNRSFYRTLPSLYLLFGFSRDEIDQNILAFSRGRVDYPDDEVRESLEWAFDNFQETDLNQLKDELRNQERNGGTKAMKSVLNMLIKIKSDFTPKESELTNKFFNIYLKGTSNRMVMAHHDVANPSVDNCNDNSASVINAIATKMLMPEINIAITDGEEVGGIGASRTGEKIRDGYFGDIEFVLNLELTAVGGKNFFVEQHETPLQERILSLFPDIPQVRTPFHDGIILRRFGIDSVVINPLPRLESGELDMKLLSYCHSGHDTIDLANFDDMKEFVEEVIIPIVRD